MSGIRAERTEQDRSHTTLTPRPMAEAIHKHVRRCYAIITRVWLHAGHEYSCALMARRTPELLQYLGKQDHQKLFQVLTRLPRFGMGRKFTRAIWRLEDTTIKAHPSYWTITRVVPNKVVTKSAVCVARPSGLDLGTQNCPRFILGYSDKNSMVTEDIQLCHHIVANSYTTILRGKMDGF